MSLPFKCPCGDIIDTSLRLSVWCRECRENPERQRNVAELHAKIDGIYTYLDRLVDALTEFAGEVGGNPHSAALQLRDALRDG